MISWATTPKKTYPETPWKHHQTDTVQDTKYLKVLLNTKSPRKNTNDHEVYNIFVTYNKNTGAERQILKLKNIITVQFPNNNTTCTLTNKHLYEWLEKMYDEDISSFWR